MAYIHSAHFQNKKLLKNASNNIYGIGEYNSQRLLARLQIKPRTRILQLSTHLVEKITDIINTMPASQSASGTNFGEEAKRIEKKNISRYIKINSYRGFRHSDGYPCRGQRTHTNAKTSRKKRGRLLIP